MNEVRFFVLHDFDKAGFSILGTLKRDTERYQFERLPDVIDLGLRLEDIESLGLKGEPVSMTKDPEENLALNGATPEEIAYLTGDGDACIQEACAGWFETHQHRRHQLRRSREECFAEFRAVTQDAQSKSWFHRTANHWSQWLCHPGFPVEGTPEERLRFVIQEHCDAMGPEFYLSSRDAALLAGINYSSASKLLRRLLKRGFI